MEAEKTSVPHRLNKDGSYDSICPNCFMTIATCEHLTDLEKAEDAHVCSGGFGVKREDVAGELDGSVRRAIGSTGD